MKPEDLPEDIDGREENPYQQGYISSPSQIPVSRGFDLFAAGWREREYWRHWKRVRNDTGRWPFWSAVFHLVVVMGIGCNGILFFWAKETQDWSAGPTWLVGSIFVMLWIVFIVIGRDAIRAYEAKLYTQREEEKKHFAGRG